MKYLFPLILIITIYANVGLAEPPLEEYVQARNPHVSHQQPQSNVNTVVDDVLNLILEQGFAGAIIVVLLGWTWKESKANRAIQKEHFEKFVEISQECSGHMASVSARLENIEREMEQAKTLQMMKG
tara:strand:+ start:245 stop:625 length:381 start_codon:yes stop_codon:yes gene_type:complete